MNIKHIAAASLLFLIAGCAAVTPIQPGRISIDDKYSVETPNTWASIRNNGPDLWTVDGLMLQTIRFVTGLEDGERLFPLPGRNDIPTFRSTMGPLEIVDFFRASIETANGSDFKSSNFRPSAFGGKPGFRFEYSFLTKDGLAMSGFAAGTLIEERLYMIFYMGTEQYYFDKHKGDAEKIVASVKFI